MKAQTEFRLIYRGTLGGEEGGETPWPMAKKLIKQSIWSRIERGENLVPAAVVGKSLWWQ